MLLAEVCLLTNDVRRLSGFYQKVLGTVADCDGDVHQTLNTEGVALAIYNDGTFKNSANQNMCLAFSVEDVDAEFERLKRMDVEIVDPPETRPWGARNMHFRDPDGNHIYFRTFIGQGIRCEVAK